MPQFEGDIGPEQAAALTAIDSTLAGEPVGSEHAEVAELALIISTERPRPRPEFARALDERVARRFTRAPAPERPPRGAGRRRRWLQAAALGTAGVLAAIVVLASLGTLASGGGSSHHELVTNVAGRTSRSSAVVAASSSESATSAASSPGSGASFGAASGVPSAANRQVVQSAQLVLAARPSRIEDVAQEIFEVVATEKGVVDSSNVSAGGGSGGADFQLSVPNDNLGSTMSALSRLGGARVISRSDATSDVTGQLGGAGEKLAEARALRRALLRQLEAATTPAQVAGLRLQLRDADASVNGDLSTLRALHRQVDDSKIGLTIQSAPPTVAPLSGSSFTFGRALHDAARVLVVAAGVGVIVLAGVLPLGLVAALVAWAGSAVRRRRRDAALDLL